MTKERQRNEDRVRQKRGASDDEDQSGEVETQTQAADEASVAVEKSRATGVATKKAQMWLRPLRAALPRLKSLRRNIAKMPRIDVIERDHEVVVRAAVAGIAREGLDVALAEGDTLTIRGQAPGAERDGDYYCYRELPHGSFERSVALPCEVEAERASGSIRDGLLELVLPKAERAQRRSIAIH